MCGEQFVHSRLSYRILGSSPRVRGTGLTAPPQECLPRIIPACAGNRSEYLLLHESERDHPRVCGEQSQPRTRRRSRRGSSPRVRGTASMLTVRSAEEGIIPACAGNRVMLFMKSGKDWDHPRVCGEQTFTFDTELLSQGSSPRVRGTV